MRFTSGDICSILSSADIEDRYILWKYFLGREILPLDHSEEPLRGPLCYDEASQNWFYLNLTTGETSWDEPEEYTLAKQQYGGQEMVAVIAATGGYAVTRHEPLCAKCFNNHEPIYKSKVRSFRSQIERCVRPNRLGVARRVDGPRDVSSTLRRIDPLVSQSRPHSSSR